MHGTRPTATELVGGGLQLLTDRPQLVGDRFEAVGERAQLLGDALAVAVLLVIGLIVERLAAPAGDDGVTVRDAGTGGATAV